MFKQCDDLLLTNMKKIQAFQAKLALFMLHHKAKTYQYCKFKIFIT